MHTGTLTSVFLCAALVFAPAWIVSAADPTAANLEFFEKKIRPLLSKHCYECHSAKKAKANLRLDRAAGWITGGDSGAAITPGKPDESLLLDALRYDGLEMPPAGKLPDESIRLFEEWIARGAPAPADHDAPPARSAGEIDLAKGREHWAYRPPRQAIVPAIDDPACSAHPIDRFVFSRLQAAGLAPQPAADRATLVRRLYFDLWGLPPAPADIECVERDESAQWYENLVDRLLASPHFGERWGRHWLDVVRFGESMTLRGFIFPDAWRYRDYVIEFFNSDRPYGDFLREQIAGDLLPADALAERQRRLVATTFLALGNTNLEEQDKRQLEMDVVDEQLDVIGKAFLGQTIGCARCHDHKFDPIPTRDYYALAGILKNVQTLEHANVSKWMEVPLPLPPAEEAPFTAHEAAVAALKQQIDETSRQLAAADGAESNAVVLASLAGVVIDDSQAKKVGAWQSSQHTKPFLGDGYVHDQDQEKGEKSITFAPELPRDGRYEIRLAYTPGSNRAPDVPVTVFTADGEKLVHVNMKARPPIDGHFVSLGEYRCEVAGQSFVLVTNEETHGHVIVDAVQFLPCEDAAPPAARGDKQESVVDTDVAQVAAASKKKLDSLQSELKRLEKNAPQRPQVMSVVERAEIADAKVHLRGSVHSQAELVPRGFLQVVAPAPMAPLPAGQSGRLELAAWIASPENPLTARVFVNRVWHWLFGAGLVRTVDNFGTTGELPSHPELLDHLTLHFLEHGSSVKQLVRYVVLSQAYRRSSHASEDARSADPENRLLAHQNRQRLEAECLRDCMLATSGELRTDMGGPTIRPGTKADYDYVDDDTRRSVYVPVTRNSLPDLFEVFDFADPSMVVGRRNVSTVAPQALFMMNHPFVRAWAIAAAERLLAADLPDDEARLAFCVRQTLGRAPSAAEADVIRRSLSMAKDSEQDHKRAWADVYQLLFSSLDFRYRD